MARGLLVVQSQPADPGREDEYNAWYAAHLEDVRAVPGFVSARRYKVPGSEPGEYLAVYEIEADDLRAPMSALRGRDRDGGAGATDAIRMDPPPTVTLYELID